MTFYRKKSVLENGKQYLFYNCGPDAASGYELRLKVCQLSLFIRKSLIFTGRQHSSAVCLSVCHTLTLCENNVS